MRCAVNLQYTMVMDMDMVMDGCRMVMKHYTLHNAMSMPMAMPMPVMVLSET